MSADEFVQPAAADDFNGYVNGAWLAKTSIPDDQSRWGSFMLLREDNLERCRKICEAAAPGALLGEVYRKAVAPRAEHDPALLAIVQEIRTAVTDAKSYQAMAGRLFSRHGTSALMHLCKSEDAKNPELRVPHVQQHGLGLPDMSYYRDRAELWPDYKQYMADLVALHGAEAGFDAEALFEFEKEISTKHLEMAQRRDPDVTYNKREYADVAKLLPDFFGALDVDADKLSYIIVENPALLEHMRDVIARTPAATLQNHLIFLLLDKFAAFGTDAAVQCRFNFRGMKLQGQKKIDPEWKRAIAVVEQFIGDELGKVYVAQHFPLEKREVCNTMIGELKDALRETLANLEWMADDTKKEALQKLEAFGVKIGVPEEWHSIDGLWPDGLEGKSLTQAAMDWYAWDWREQEVKKFYTPPERKLWHMTPQTVNAYYHPEMNEIVFPAGILQRPFFGFDTFEENVGAIGVVIGHEMTHGFDDQGRKYNAKGELKDWWRPSDATEFDARATVVRDHYGEQLVQGKNVNGQLTLGENIADIGGLKLAIRALRQHAAKTGKELTRDVWDRFFKAYAAIWCMLVRPELELKLLAIDPHSPCHLRVNAALAHVPEFYETYDVQPDNKMHLAPERRMNIW